MNKQDRTIVNIVRGCLKSALDAHGSIQHSTLHSAAKRIAGQLRTELEAKDIPDEQKSWAVRPGIRPVMARRYRGHVTFLRKFE